MNELEPPRVTIRVAAGASPSPFQRRGEPVTLGVAFARGQARDAGWTLSDAGGRPVPVQTVELERWSDGSTRWLLVDLQADVPSGATASYELHGVSDSRGSAPLWTLQVHARRDEIVVSTGVATFHVGRAGRFLLSHVEVGGGPALDARASALVATDAAGGQHAFEITDARVELSGPLRCVVRLGGRLSLPEGAHLDVVSRLHFFCGLGAVRAELSVTNPRRARHANGFWDLGDSGSVYFRDVSLTCVPVAPIHLAWASAHSGEPRSAIELPLEIYQDSSGGEHWNSRNHVDRHGRVPLACRGYRLAAGAGTSAGLRATPIVTLGAADRALTICVPEFWQNFPKAIEASGAAVTLRLWPRQSGGLHELQGGERKTHTFVLGFGPDGVTDIPLAWSRSPALAIASGASYEAAGVWRPLSSGGQASRHGYRELVDAAIDGVSSFSAKCELIDDYGWRHFGDLYADHEAVNEPGLISHYNNQYDAIAGCATRFCETGDRRWWTAMHDLAVHVADIDMYHCSEDRAAYNHGLFWHTSHYADAQTATHRAYSRRAGRASGGPSNEHNYTTGLLLHYFLTGCERSREAVLELAGWVLDMDDGAKGRFRLIDRGDTGLASATRDPDYHGPGRGAAYSINALLDAHRLTGASRYLRKAERLVERCVHPADNPQTLGLLDAERRWSYTVFLQVIGKYLEHRAELGLFDCEFEHARTSLATYATWMAEHERPYLDHPEQLEHPTETWAAQDIRKAAVFEFAARWTSDPDAARRFKRAANRFFDHSVSTLGKMQTRALTRPVVLLLAYGFQRPLLDAPAPRLPGHTPVAEAPRRAPFVPYRRRVIARLAVAGVVTATMATALVALWLAVTH